jgi:hypothetical protein
VPELVSTGTGEAAAISCSSTLFLLHSFTTTLAQQTDQEVNLPGFFLHLLLEFFIDKDTKTPFIYVSKVPGATD